MEAAESDTASCVSLSSALLELPAFLPLTALSVGRFASTHHSMIFLWVSGIKGIGRKTETKEKKLVIVVVQDEAKKQPAVMLQSSWALKNSPFFAPLSESSRPYRGVCSFEICLDEIAGLDYWNPLLVDASRVVIEARRLTRRWFPDLSSCQAHFAWETSGVTSGVGSSQHAGSPLYQPQAAGNAVTMQKVELRTENCKLHTSPSKVRQTYWQPRPEEASYARLNALAETAQRVLRPRSLDEDFAKTDETPSEAGEVYGCDGGTGSSVGVLNTSQEVVELLYNRTVNFRFDDPFLPYVLREVIHDPEHHRLLRLCEAGIPAWAIVLPKFTGLYHRYMRHLVAAIVVLVSCLSMLLGFYDLYKRIPLVRSLLKQSLGPLSSKLEELVVVRLSFLLGWILPYNTILRRTWHGLQMLWDFLKSICLGLFSAATMATSAASSLLQPATSFFFSPVIGAASAGRSVFQAVATTGNAFARLFSGSGSSFSSGFGTAGLLRAEFNMARQAFMSVYNSTCFLGATIAKHQASTSVWLSRWRHRQWRRVAKLTERPLWLLVLLILAFTRFYPGDFTVRCGDSILWDLAVAVTRFF
ncbi:unnamed protein product [Durusdinium trenchii]|uniref:Transmembrane protein n=1 Tax=Durusdinium trenchii TaxID=1381693 RepID=A0ABP0L6F9_9DINO